MDVYKWKVEFDNGATIENKTGIAFATDIGYVSSIVDSLLCKHSEDCIRNLQIEKIEVSNGDAFEIK